MAYRLRIAAATAGLPDAAQRTAPLRRGENLIGSRPACEVAIVHPSVSRDHAVLVWGEDRLSLTDLGSSNGSFVDGRRLGGTVELRPGSRLTFGTVEAELEEVADGDAVAMPLRSFAAAATPDARSGTAAVPETAETPSTAAVGPVPHFALGHLPRLVTALRRGRSRAEMALLVGDALVQALPCRGVEIVGRSGDDAERHEAILFRWGTVVADERSRPAGLGGAVELRVGFSSSGNAALLGPLVDVAHQLLLLAPAGGSEPRSSPATGRERESAGADAPPALPEPPSLDPTMRDIYARAAVIAASDVHVLIRGESGTGKEVLARFLHRHAAAPERPFVTLNCAALPRDLLEAELFGIDKGVATGVTARPGKFELADGGTLFLDEIGDMAAATQAKILRVLQEGEVLRVGSHQPRPARVRVVSATNRDLDAMRRDGAFRDDLYHRIADWVVELPPLRDRAVDVPHLAGYFLERAAERLGRRVAGISRAAVDALVAYPWPGNIRQLEREIGRAVLFVGDGELLDTSRLSSEVVDAAADGGWSLQEQLARHERRLLEQTLAAAAGDATAAAARLEVPISTFYRKLKKLGVESPG